MQDTGFLERILDHKRTEVERQQHKVPLQKLLDQLADTPPIRPFATALRQSGRLALIAEVKKQSPAKGLLVPNFDALKLAQIYAANGADAISVLTDVRFWGGSLQYLKTIREALPAGPPLLRKDVVIDPYQVYEARAYGADAVLLIVAALAENSLSELYQLCLTLGMDVLIEVHDEAELARAMALQPALLGINNRNLRTFAVDIETTRRLIEHILPGERPVIVSESGIDGGGPGGLERLRGWGADAILVGEAIVTAPDPAAKVRTLVGRSA